MAYSLLAHLIPHIRGSQEDIATYSLQYLLLQSQELNRAFTKRITDLLHTEEKETLQYLCQATGKGEEKERPDMVGLNSDGKEDILFEMKFYATLTQNQPLTYLNRLKDNGGNGLVFVCPMARKTNLWSKLKELCKEQLIEEVDDNCIKVDGINLAIISWTEIINLLKKTASDIASRYSSDIVQLEGYCNRIDSEEFLPFSAEDLSAQVANKAERYYAVLDEVVELFCADSKFNTSKQGTKKSAYRKGYTRSIYIDNLTFTINYDRDMWKNPVCVETPFWIAIRDEDWYQDEHIVKKFDSIPENRKQIFWDMVFLALEPLQNATFSEVCEDLKQQIERYIDIAK